MYDTIAFLKTCHDEVMNSSWRWQCGNIDITKRCAEAYSYCFHDLQRDYPWAFRHGEGEILQNVCLPITGSTRKNLNRAMDYDDDCEDSWQDKLDFKFEKRVYEFTWHLAQIISF